MIRWDIFLAMAIAGYDALVKHFEAQNAARRKTEIDRIVSCVSEAKDKILSTVVTLRMAELRGKMEGYCDRYRSYTPGEPEGNERLRSLIDDSALTIGELGALVDLLHQEHDIAFDAYGPYINLLHLRAQAMVERERAYGVPEIANIGWSFENAVVRAESLLGHLRQEINSQFSSPRLERYGRPESHGDQPEYYRFVYTKGGRRIVCCKGEGRISPPCTWQLAVDKYNADREQTFQKHHLVQPIDQSQDDLAGFLSRIQPLQTEPSIKELFRQRLQVIPAKRTALGPVVVPH